MTPDADIEDAALVARAAAGDERAFTLLMRRHKDGLYRLLRRYTGDADEAYDLLQESFAAAWSALGRFDRHRSFGIWLRSIALNKGRDWSRRRAIRGWLTRSAPHDGPAGRTLADPGLDPEAAVADRQALARIDAAVAALPPGLKAPLILTTLDDLSHAEAGQLLGLSAKAVELRVYRARQALARALGLADGG